MTALTLELLGDHGPVYGPPDGADLPGVVILHGSEGPMAGWSHRFAAILAAHGLLALPWSYGEGDVWGAGSIRNVDIRGVEAAVDALRAHPRCRTAGLFGWSKGGELALLVASLLETPARLPFVAAHAPSDIVGEAFDPERFRGKGTRDTADPWGPAAWSWPEHERRLVPGTEIEIERYTGPVFLSVGDADTVMDPACTLRLADRLKAAGTPPDLFVAKGQDHALAFDVEPELWSRLLTFIGRST